MKAEGVFLRVKKNSELLHLRIFVSCATPKAAKSYAESISYIAYWNFGMVLHSHCFRLQILNRSGISAKVLIFHNK